jgi:phosphatidylinositol alpha 1,6-mannosyltransferase
MVAAPRVAFFPDSFHEVNGVAHTARNFVAYARRHDLPMLCVRAALPLQLQGRKPMHESHPQPQPKRHTEGSVSSLELPRSRASIGMEKDLSFDPLFARHAVAIERSLRAFNADIIHITGPSELGMFGAYFAWKLGIPLVASWHTNVHEYRARRLGGFGRFVPASPGWIEEGTLAVTARFYRLAKVLYAPNAELCTLLQQRTGRPCHEMRRGVDTELFTPARRTRSRNDGEIVVGYVGRLSVEKNIMLLPRIDAALRAAGLNNVRFRIVGHGGDEVALRAALPGAEFCGVLRGNELAAAYADMDLFVFPSETDTFGNVVLEALACGVPAAVTLGGGPKFIVQNGVTGVARAANDLPAACVSLVQNPQQLQAMGQAARAYALTCRWDAIFDGVYAAYPSLHVE